MTSANTVAIPRSTARRRFLLYACPFIAIAVIAAALFGLDQIWPYRYRNVEPTLDTVFASKIKIDHYYRTYFPYPGFVADGVTLRRNSAPDLPPLGSIEHIRVQGRWLDLLFLRRRIHRILAEGLHIVVPPVGSRANHEDFPAGSANDFTGPTTVVEQLDIRNAQLDILRNNGGRYSFPIRSLLIGNLQQNATITYALDMQNARPTGRIQATGTFGPLFADQLASTPVTGNVNVTQIALNQIGNLQGTLASTAHFQGTLASIEVTANSSIPDFAVGHAHSTPITGISNGSVSALTGDISLRSIDVHIGRTHVHVQGSIVGSPPSGGKLTNLDLTIANGRVEDILHPFLAHASPIIGPVQMRSHVTLAAAAHGETFLQRLTLDGAFDIPHEVLTDPATEHSLNAFSQRAQGLPSPPPDTSQPDVLSSLDGAIVLHQGLAHVSRLSLQFPGAAILLSGTFDLPSQAVALQGNLSMHSDISHVTTGFKSFLLKPLAPFFRRNNAGAVIPIAITGQPQHYKINQNIFHFDTP